MGTIKVDGNLTIQNYNNQSGSSLAVAMPGGVVQQNMQSGKTENNDQPAKTSSSITLNPKKGMKVNLFRVVFALHKLGFFVDKAGSAPDQEDVFQAFGDMLGKDYSKYFKDLSEASKKKNEVTIFQELEQAFAEYEEDKLEASAKRK